MNKTQILQEVISCKATGIPSAALIKEWKKIISVILNTSKLKGYSIDTKEDLEAYALYYLVKSWHHFNPNVSDNPDGYFKVIISSAFIYELCRQNTQRLKAKDDKLWTQDTLDEIRNPS